MKSFQSVLVACLYLFASVGRLTVDGRLIKIEREYSRYAERGVQKVRGEGDAYPANKNNENEPHYYRKGNIGGFLRDWKAKSRGHTMSIGDEVQSGFDGNDKKNGHYFPGKDKGNHYYGHHNNDKGTVKEPCNNNDGNHRRKRYYNNGQVENGEVRGNHYNQDEYECDEIVVMAKTDDILHGFEKTSISEESNSFPLYDTMMTDAPVGWYTDAMTSLRDGRDCLVKGSIRLHGYARKDEESTEQRQLQPQLRKDDSQIRYRGSCSSTYNSIIGGTGSFARTTGYSSVSPGADDGTWLLSLHVCRPITDNDGPAYPTRHKSQLFTPASSVPSFRGARIPLHTKDAEKKGQLAGGGMPLQQAYE